MTLVLTILLNVFAGPKSAQALGLEKALQSNRYIKYEKQYVNSSRILVAAVCNSGDTLVEGSCFGENRMIGEQEHEHGVLLESTKQNEQWNCQAKLQHPSQVLLVTSKAVCTKPEPAALPAHE